MDFQNYITSFLGFTPSTQAQEGYKKRAKQNKLLSIVELQQCLNSKDMQTLNAVQNKEIELDMKLSIPVDTKFEFSNIENAKSNGKNLTMKDVVIFNNKNFHRLEMSKKDLQNIVDTAKDQKLLVNVNHEGFYPEKNFGYVSNVQSNGSDTLTADVELDVTRTCFAEQYEAITKDGAELGFSVEVEFDDVLLSFKTWDITYVDPKLTGLATTLIPSAPKTLLKSTDLSTMPDDKNQKTNLDTAGADNQPAPEPVKLEVAPTVDAEVKIAELNATYLKELEIYKTDLSSKNEEITKLQKTLASTIAKLSEVSQALEKSNETAKTLKNENLSLRSPKSINTFY
jgi:hypothetical protein